MIWNTCSSLPAWRAATASRTMAVSQPVIQRAARIVERYERSLITLPAATELRRVPIASRRAVARLPTRSLAFVALPRMFKSEVSYSPVISRPSRSVSGAFRFKAILALPALSRRPEDHRRHRRACGDCQGYSRTWACLCAPPRSPARPLALFQAGLILKAKAVLQCPDDPARPALACSGQTVSKRFGPIQGSNNHREREIFTKHRAIDRLSGRRYSQSRTGKRWFQIPIPLLGILIPH